MLFLLTDSSKTKIGKDSWERFMKIILLCKPEFSSATKTFFIKNTKKAFLRQVTGGNTPNIVLKRMLRYFLKTPPVKIYIVLKRMLEFFLTVSPLKKILQFQERICFFFLKAQNTTSSASVWWGNNKSSFKENAITFSKSSITQEIRISKPKTKTMKFVQKENFEPKIKLMIENLQDKLYQ